MNILRPGNITGPEYGAVLGLKSMKAVFTGFIGLLFCLVLTSASVLPYDGGLQLLSGEYNLKAAHNTPPGWSVIADLTDERAHAIDDRMIQIRFRHPQRWDRSWQAGSGVLALRSNVALTAAHTFYKINEKPDPRTGKCSCTTRDASHGNAAIANMEGVAVRLYDATHPERITETGVTKAFPENHCRFVRPVNGKCIIPPEHDFVALHLDRFLRGGKPLDMRPGPDTGRTVSFEFSGFPTDMDGTTLVTSSCRYQPDNQPRWTDTTMQTLTGPACTAARGMSGGPVLEVSRNAKRSPEATFKGILLAVQKDRIVYRKRDELVERCIRSAAEFDPRRPPAATLITVGYNRTADCPVMQR
jgi:hypothetical protein